MAGARQGGGSPRRLPFLTTAPLSNQPQPCSSPSPHPRTPRHATPHPRPNPQSTSGTGPLSRVTAGAIEDIYGKGSVNYANTDPW
jgi:hypothetical protein